MSNPSDLKWLSEAARRMRPAFVRLVVSCVLLILVYSLEEPITRLLKLFVEESLAETLYLVLLAPLMLLTSYYIFRVYASISTSVIEGPLAKLKIRSAVPTILLLNKIFGLVLLFITALWLLSRKIPFLYSLVEGLVGSFSGVFSLLIALVLAMQVKEIVGNFLAGLMIKTSGVIIEGEYISIGEEYYRIEKIDLSYTKVTDLLSEETYIPNLKFLIESFRKPFSKDSRRYIDLRFSLPYKYPIKEVEQRVSELVEQHNTQTRHSDARIDDFRLVIVSLADYSVVYELRVKPSQSVFPEAMRSNVRRLVYEKFGEDLATPMILDVRKQV
jgi:small-conductance mechanosensitive channel